jgi:DNA-binding NtrC family response regulator
MNRNVVGMAASILVIEDDPSIRNLICRALCKEGYQIVEASNGAQALKLLCTQRFDLVITAFVMPKVNGLKLVEELHSVHPRIPIIFMTGHLSVLSGNAILNGVAEILPKPFDLAVLRSTIQRMLHGSSASSSPDGRLRGKPNVMIREEIEELMEELNRQFAATRDPEIREELYELARKLATMEDSNFEKPSELKAPGQPEQKKVPMLLRDLSTDDVP